MSFLLRKVEDVTTISKSQSLTLVSIKDCTLRVPNETTTLFLVRVIIKAIFITGGGAVIRKLGSAWLEGTPANGPWDKWQTHTHEIKSN
jgi:hypothetical protein